MAVGVGVGVWVLAVGVPGAVRVRLGLGFSVVLFVTVELAVVPEQAPTARASAETEANRASRLFITLSSQNEQPCGRGG